MKKKITFASAALIVVLATGMQPANAQQWSLSGNNATDTSKLGSKNNKPVRFFSNNIERMRIGNNGLVGIGTLVPGALLHVNSTSSGEVLRLSGSIGTYSTIYEGSAYRGYWGSYSGNPEDVDFGTGGGNLSGKLHLTIQGAPRATIDASGNMGIGTITPSAKLHVAGSVKIDGANVLEFGAGLAKEVSAGKIGYGTFTPGSLEIIGAGTNTTNRRIKFWNEGGAEFTSNVMIGTATPATGYKLSVNGKIMCEELKVLLRGSWPDFVFNNNYQPMDLLELESYINVNKHLPGIEPATKLEKDGVEIGEMQRLMMQKIEELTLYVIELKKENDAIRQMITPAVQ